MCELLLDLISKENISSLGLLFDLVGVICIAISFKNIRREKKPFARGFTNYDHDNIVKVNNKEHRLLISLDRWGVTLLVTGFVLQIISNYIS